MGGCRFDISFVSGTGGIVGLFCVYSNVYVHLQLCLDMVDILICTKVYR